MIEEHRNSGKCQKGSLGPSHEQAEVLGFILQVMGNYWQRSDPMELYFKNINQAVMCR